jgi:lactoylglutathione lyase
VFSKHRHGSGPEHYAHEAKSGVLELYPSSAANPADRVGLGFSHGDLDALAGQLTELGLEPGPIQEQPWGTTFVVRDPDDRRVEIQATAAA